MEINVIQEFFEANVPKKKLSIISLDKENGVSLINSSKLSYDFDIINTNIKTSDTVYFNDNKIIFVEFKRGKIGDTDFRLKATESIISLFNYLHKNDIVKNICLPSDFFQIYFVYDRARTSAPKLFTFSESEKKLSSEYKHLFSKLKVIDNDQFQKLFKI